MSTFYERTWNNRFRLAITLLSLEVIMLALFLVLHFRSPLREIPDHSIPAAGAETHLLHQERESTYAWLDKQAIVEVGGKQIIRPKYV